MNPFRIFLLLVPAFALSVPSAEDRVFSEGGILVDNFLIRTTHRISESWTFSRIEFQMASDCAIEESKEKAREEVRKQTGAAMDHVREKVVEMIQNAPSSFSDKNADPDKNKRDKKLTDE